MSAPVGLVVNPRSHAVLQKGSVLEAAAGNMPDALLVRFDTVGQLELQMAGLARQGGRQVYVEGGDGTLQAVLTASLAPRTGFNVLPEFAILPGGSTNLAYKILGLKLKTPEAALDYIQQRARHGHRLATARHQALVIDSRSLANPAIGFLLSTGSLARAMIYTQQELHREGHRGSLAIAGALARLMVWPSRHLGRDGQPLLRPSPLAATASHFSVKGDHALSLMTTLPTLSLRLRPYWGEEIAPIAFTHASWPIRGLHTALLKVMTGQAGRNMIRHGLVSHRVDGVGLEYKGPVMLDGEILPTPEDGLFAVGVTPPIRFMR
ncbi:MAG: hypothetical protein KKC43_11780 [Alphaproteobacteria bacterium]|nr:hypothetical protein [Alphaproteobacteria bacterium]